MDSPWQNECIDIPIVLDNMNLPISTLDRCLWDQSSQDSIYHHSQWVMIGQDLPPFFLENIAVSLCTEVEFLLRGDDDKAASTGFLHPEVDCNVRQDSFIRDTRISSYRHNIRVVPINARNAEPDDDEVPRFGILDEPKE